VPRPVCSYIVDDVPDEEMFFSGRKALKDGGS